MSIIDDKGRVFGKVNIIDFIFIVLLISALPVFYYGSRLAASKKPVEVKKVKVEVKIRFSRVVPELISVIKEGDADKDPRGSVVGVLKKVDDSRQAGFVGLGKNDEVVVAPDPTALEITATFDLTCSYKDGVLDYRGYQIKIGNNVVFSTDLYSMQGLVVGIKK